MSWRNNVITHLTSKKNTRPDDNLEYELNNSIFYFFLFRLNFQGEWSTECDVVFKWSLNFL